MMSCYMITDGIIQVYKQDNSTDCGIHVIHNTRVIVEVIEGQLLLAGYLHSKHTTACRQCGSIKGHGEVLSCYS